MKTTRLVATALRDPAALVPGTSMAYSNSLGEADIEALLVFLKSAGH